MEWTGAISGAVAALVGKILFDWLRQQRRHNGGDNHSPDYKTLRADLDEIQRLGIIRKIVKEELDLVIRTEFERDPRRRRSE